MINWRRWKWEAISFRGARFIIVSLFCGHFSKRLFYRVFGTGRRTFIPARTESSVKSCKNKSGVNQWYPTAQMECTKGNWRKIKEPRLRALLRAYFNKIASVMQQTICWCPSLLFCRYVCHPRVFRRGGGFCCFILLLPRWLAKKTLLLCQQCNLLQIKDCSCHIYYPTFLWWRDTRPRHPLYTLVHSGTLPPRTHVIWARVWKSGAHVESGVRRRNARLHCDAALFWSKLFQKLYMRVGNALGEQGEKLHLPVIISSTL